MSLVDAGPHVAGLDFDRLNFVAVEKDRGGARTVCRGEDLIGEFFF